ncbi:unnamed protein product, partial [marine sediment metagenome]
LFVFIMLVSGIEAGNCSDGTPYGQCSAANPGMWCTGTLASPTLQLYVEHCPCSINSNYVEVSGTCVLKEGCAYGTISCGTGYECVNNVCVLKTGCDYDNPSCNAANESCVNNECVLKSGCDYDNPSCGANETCINNECVLEQEEGCAYDNPPCDFEYKCVNNVCILKDIAPPPNSSNYIPLPTNEARANNGNDIMERIQQTCCCSTALLIFFVIGTGLVSVRG